MFGDEISFGDEELKLAVPVWKRSAKQCSCRAHAFAVSIRPERRVMIGEVVAQVRITALRSPRLNSALMKSVTTFLFASVFVIGLTLKESLSRLHPGSPGSCGTRPTTPASEMDSQWFGSSFPSRALLRPLPLRARVCR